MTTERYGTNELVNMGRTIPLPWFKVIQYSTDAAAIENAVDHLDLSFLTLNKTEITEKKDDRIQVTTLETGVIENIFYLGANGLIVKEEKQIGDYRFETEYTYQFTK